MTSKNPNQRRRVSGPIYFLGRPAAMWRAAIDGRAKIRHRTRPNSPPNS